MTARIALAACSLLVAHGCAQSDTKSSPAPSTGDGVLEVPEVVCPSGTDLQTRTSSTGTETYCVRTLPQNPNVDVGPPRIQTGPSVTRFPGGKASAFGEYADGFKTGTWHYFHLDGTRLAEGRYDAKGGRVGVWNEWRSGGKLRTEATYVDARLEGPWRNVWGERVVGEGAFKEGLPSGTWTSHFCTGGVHETVTLAEGKLDGPCSRFEATGRKYLDGAYRNGKKSGVWRQSFSNGVHFESSWADDARDGLFRWFTADGKVTMEGSLRSGKLDGRWVMRDAAGDVGKEGFYEDGQLARGTDVTNELKLNGYESNAYCAYNLQGFTPLPSTGGPAAGADPDLTTVVCDRF